MELGLKSMTGAGGRHKSTSLRRNGWIGAALVLVIALIALWWRLHSQAAGSPALLDSHPNATAIGVSIQVILPTATRRYVEVTGTVHTELVAPIASKVMARVDTVLVREGDKVRRGQPLILLDARDLDASVDEAKASLRASDVGYDNSRVAARMESSLSTAQIAEAKAKIGESEAAVQATVAHLDLVQAGPRPQERAQAALAVTQAQSNLTLAESTMKRMASLYNEGAISAQQYDQYKSQVDVAQSQFETALQKKSAVDEGSRIEDIHAAQQAVREAQAAVQEAKSGLKSAVASGMQAEVRRHEIQGARAQIGQSQASLEMARVARDYAVITSPFDGIVTSRMSDPGAMASPGVPLLTVEGGAQRLEADVPESVLVSVKKGEAVSVHFDALHNYSLMGRVVEIAPQGDSASHTFVVKIELPIQSGTAPGMFGRAQFATGAERRLLVPTSALTEREGLDYLYVVDNNNVARLRMVTVGEPDGESVPVLSGLSSGERIVTASKQQVSDGSQVTEGSR